MAKHTVNFELTQISLGNGDFIFQFFKGKEKFGRLAVSKRAVKWFPKNHEHPHEFSWDAFDKAMKKKTKKKRN